MNTLPPLNDANRASLRDNLESAEPPADLRERVLRVHATRRTAARAAPFLAVIVATWGLAIMTTRSDDSLRDWQSRSGEMEASWRANGDREWLLADARAQPLLYRLRCVDEAIAQFDGSSSSDTRSLAQLWRERTETLSALVDSRRQGGVAIQL